MYIQRKTLTHSESLTLYKHPLSAFISIVLASSSFKVCKMRSNSKIAKHHKIQMLIFKVCSPQRSNVPISILIQNNRNIFEVGYKQYILILLIFPCRVLHDSRRFQKIFNLPKKQSWQKHLHKDHDVLYVLCLH